MRSNDWGINQCDSQATIGNIHQHSRINLIQINHSCSILLLFYISPFDSNRQGDFGERLIWC
jgi:hypothetical protein